MVKKFEIPKYKINMYKKKAEAQFNKTDSSEELYKYIKSEYKTLIENNKNKFQEELLDVKMKLLYLDKQLIEPQAPFFTLAVSVLVGLLTLTINNLLKYEGWTYISVLIYGVIIAAYSIYKIITTEHKKDDYIYYSICLMVLEKLEKKQICLKEEECKSPLQEIAATKEAKKILGEFKKKK